MHLRGPFRFITNFNSGAQFDPSQGQSYTRDPSILVYHAVPFIHQRHVNLCGDACVNMLLAFYERPYQTKLNNPRSILEGLSPHGVISKLQAAGLTFLVLKPRHIGQMSWTMKELVECMITSGPLITRLKTYYGLAGHWIILIGIGLD